VAVNNSIKVGPLVFLLQMFVITENIMKRPVYTISLLHVSAKIVVIFTKVHGKGYEFITKTF